MTTHSRTWAPSIQDAAIRLVTVAALVVDAVVHLQLASNYQLAAPAGIGGGNLFRIESGIAIIAAVLVLVSGSKTAYALAFLIAFGGLVAVVLYRYVDVPAFGPIPAMYEPVWYFKKTLTAVAEGVATVTAAVGYLSHARLQRN